jgi:hypothetical protein
MTKLTLLLFFLNSLHASLFYSHGILHRRTLFPLYLLSGKKRVKLTFFSPLIPLPLVPLQIDLTTERDEEHRAHL